MKALLLLPLLALASCAPLLSQAQGTAASLSRDGASVLLTNPAGQGALLSPTVRLEGPGLTLGAPCVQRAINVYGCVLSDIPEGKAYRLTPAAGSVSKASATFYTLASGSRFLFIELP